jgi:hypothetical protein
MSTTSLLTTVDWPTFGGATATFIGTLWLTVKGLQKGKAKVESGQSTITSIIGGSLMDNETLRNFTDQLRKNVEHLQSLTEEVRRNTAAITRQTDLDLMQSRKLNYRDNRDNS